MNGMEKTGKKVKKKTCLVPGGAGAYLIVSRRFDLILSMRCFQENY